MGQTFKIKTLAKAGLRPWKRRGQREVLAWLSVTYVALANLTLLLITLLAHLSHRSSYFRRTLIHPPQKL